ncbi:acetylornithine carbamoyltransferase, partial [Nonlabens mediterrranea]|nr:acetylornithine carbamoyltransferase [Nonlabens mediterrranea]
MKKYTELKDIKDLSQLVDEAIAIKQTPFEFQHLGKNKTLVMLFFNASLRTRISTEKAAKNLGLEVQILNVNDSWKLEFDDGTIMNADTDR